jgi:hypothetical protein
MSIKKYNNSNSNSNSNSKSKSKNKSNNKKIVKYKNIKSKKNYRKSKKNYRKSKKSSKQKNKKNMIGGFLGCPASDTVGNSSEYNIVTLKKCLESGSSGAHGPSYDYLFKKLGLS